MQKLLLTLLTCAWAGILASCGGSGFPPQVTAVKVQTLQYGRTATIYLGGVDLRSTLKANLGSGCTNPSFALGSTTELLVLNCKVATTGELPLTLEDGNGKLIYSTTLRVLDPQVLLTTAEGNITLALDPSHAPITVLNFLNYVNSGYYTNTLFHRVIADFVVQGGGYTSGIVKKEGQTSPIMLESNRGLSNLRGTLAMARNNEPNSATSEFFINLVDNTFLDYQSESRPGYAVFGKVTNGLALVDAIATQTTGVVNGLTDVPLKDVTILRAQQIQ